jgi:hypothetical protein
VSSADLGAEGRWPAFRQLVIAAGIRAWLSVPVRQRHGPIGALDFAHTDPQPWQPQDLATSSAFARLIMATLELAAARQQEGLTPELQFAVQHDARVEQARGVLMECERVDETAASTLLRQQAQIEGRPLRAIAERILARGQTLTLCGRCLPGLKGRELALQCELLASPEGGDSGPSVIERWMMSGVYPAESLSARWPCACREAGRSTLGLPSGGQDEHAGSPGWLCHTPGRKTGMDGEEACRERG